MDPCLESLKKIVDESERNINAKVVGVLDTALRIESYGSIKKTYLAQRAYPYAMRLVVRVTDATEGIKKQKPKRRAEIFDTLVRLCSQHDLLLIETQQSAFYIGVTFPCMDNTGTCLEDVFPLYLEHLDQVYDKEEQTLLDLKEKVKRWLK